MADHGGGDHPTLKGGIAISINPLYPLDAESYQFVSEIGRGGVSSTVHKATCNSVPIDSSVVAIKVIDLHKTNPGFEINEMTAIIPLHHNILKPYCIFTVKPSSVWVVMPFISGGSLQSIVASSYPDGLPEEFIVAILKQILTAIIYLHRHGFIHRDIKAANILVNYFSGAVKLADFGVSANSRATSTSIPTSYARYKSSGTPYWVAPEAEYLNGFRSDMWSFGITALELAHGRSPLSHLISPTKSFSDFLRNMVGSCLEPDIEKRPLIVTAERLMEQSLFFLNDINGHHFMWKNTLLQGKGTNNRLKRKRHSSDEDCSSSGETVKGMKTCGWRFDWEGFCLDPMFPDEDIDRSKVDPHRDSL